MTAINLERKSQFEQFFTPARIAEFMAGLFTQKTENICRLLDAGAGTGSLSTAFLDRWVSGGLCLLSIEADVFEIDELLCPPLARVLGEYKKFPNLSITVRNTDFIHTASEWLSNSFFCGKIAKIYARYPESPLPENS